MAVTVLGLAASACARVPSHFALPDLAMGDPAFGPTIEAYTATRVSGWQHGGRAAERRSDLPRHPGCHWFRSEDDHVRPLLL